MLELETLHLNPCGGTHLRSLSEIQLIKVRRALERTAPCWTWDPNAGC